MGVPDERDDAVERSARFWLRAYPRRYRDARGAEMLGLLLDLTPPGARTIGVRAAANLVWSGWRTRVRTRPPLGPWLLYRLFDRRLRGHQGWVRDDVEGTLGPVRRMLVPMAFVLVALGQGATHGLVLVVVVAVVLGWSTQRKQARTQHLVARPGQPLVAGTYQRVPAPRRRLAARVGLLWAIGVTVVLGAMGVASVVVAPEGFWARPMPAGAGHSAGFEVGTGAVVERWPAVVVVLAALVLGLACVPMIRRRLRTGATAPQTERDVVGMQPLWALHTVGWAGLVGALVAAEILGRFPLLLGAGVAAGAAFLLPGLGVALVALRGAPPRITLVDVRQLAAYGRTYPDAPGWRLEPIAPQQIV